MKVTVSHDALDRVSSDLLALQLYSNDDSDFSKDARFAAIDKAFAGELSKIVKAEHFKAKPDQALFVHGLSRIKARGVLLVGAGAEKDHDADKDRSFAANAIRKASSMRAESLVLVSAPNQASDAERAYALMLGARLAAYRFDRYRTKEKKDAPPKLQTLTLWLKANKKDNNKIDQQVEHAKVLAQAVTTARDLINEPASVITPDSFAKEAKRIAKATGLSIEVLELDGLKKNNMGMLLGVAQGSDHPPRLVHLSYKPKGKTTNKKRVALIGKGVTFDSGGLSLKPAAGMEDMKVDMSGGAAVLAAMSVVPSLDLDYEVHGFIGLVENMPSGKAYRPGDVLHSRNGLTVEVNNTDAEGRLVLGDVIDYAKSKVDPTVMIDLATLTGACIVALGPYTSGLFSNDDDLANALLSAAKRSGEDIWRLPLTDALKDMLKSDVADMKNSGGREGGAITGALFLREFVGKTPWVHLDIAGPATSNKDKGTLSKGGTGFAVATLVEYLSGKQKK